MFWERYCLLCKEKGLSRTAAGTEIGVSGNAVNKWKTGSRPKDETLEKVAAYFGVTVPYLLGYTDSRTPAADKKNTPAEAGAGEGLTAQQLYVQGLMSALPEAVQEEIARFAEYTASRYTE